MSYKKMVATEAQEFLDKLGGEFQDDAGDHGGKSETPNLSRWLDRTRRLFEHLDVVTKSWKRAEIETVRNASRNSVAYGDPKEAAYFAYYKDIVAEVKKRSKRR